MQQANPAHGGKFHLAPNFSIVISKESKHTTKITYKNPNRQQCTNV